MDSRRGDLAHPDRHGGAVPDLSYPAIRWVKVVAAVFLVLFNVVGLPYLALRRAIDAGPLPVRLSGRARLPGWGNREGDHV